MHMASSYLPPYDTLEQDHTPTETFLTSVKPLNLIWSLDANSRHSMVVKARCHGHRSTSNGDSSRAASASGK